VEESVGKQALLRRLPLLLVNMPLLSLLLSEPRAARGSDACCCQPFGLTW
jgi:hypothetical protein